MPDSDAHAPERAGSGTSERVIRVFISSTFRDMMKERDLLVKEVFPDLRRKCARRAVTLTEVDLRWGITEAQANEGQVLPLCLAEIERSRPYFIGLLGERYGWVPDMIRPEIVAREPWLGAYARGRTSVTELEILHGALNDPAMKGTAFFYFRDPAYAADPSLTPAERRDMAEHDIEAEVERFGPAEAARRTEERKAKLAALKQRIRESGRPLVEAYAGPPALAEAVRRELDELIDRLYPEDGTPDALERERLAHEAHARNKLFACVDRPAHLGVLDAFAAAPGRGVGDGGGGAVVGGSGLVVTGESGGGKTALLAAWARRRAAAHPRDFLFQHYFGATPDSASPEGFLRRLLGELKARFGIADDIPARPDSLREALPAWLARTSGPVRIVLVLDGLDQMQGDEPDRRLLFLPRRFPSHVTALASALPGPALEALRQRGWREHELPRAGASEAEAMVGRYLRIHARSLEPGLERELVTAPGAGNPLFLRTVLEELRQFGRHEQLAERVRYYLAADGPKDLFLRVIRRWREDFDGPGAEPEGPRHDLVGRALRLLWAARQGLSEPEWLDLLGMRPGAPPAQDPLPRAFWTPLFLAMEPHLSRRAGLFAFGHDFLRQAAEEAVLPSEDLKTSAHLALADYFEHHERQRGMSPRKAAEWPHQLRAAGAWARLESCLTDIPLFLALDDNPTRWELAGYWHPLRRLGRDMGGLYGRAYERWASGAPRAADPIVPARLGQFLSNNGLYDAAEPLLRRALEICERVLAPDHPNALGALHNLALLLERRGDYAGAQALYEKAWTAGERVLGPDHAVTLTGLNNLAGLLQKKGDYAGAQALYGRVLEARRRILGPEHPETLSSLNNLALLLEKRGDYAGARPLVAWAAETSERVLGPDHPDTLTFIGNLAGLLEKEGDYKGARALCERALEARERVLGPDHPDTLASLNNLAALLERDGDHAGARRLYERAYEGAASSLGPEHPDTLAFLLNLGTARASQGDARGALETLGRALETCGRVLGPDHPVTLSAAAGLAGAREKAGDAAGARSLYEQVLEARRRVLGPDHPDTLSCLNNLAVLLEEQGDPAGARPLLEGAFEACERVLGPDHPDTLVSAANLASLREKLGDVTGARPLYERVLKGLLEESAAKGRPHPDLQAFVYHLAHCLEALGHSREETLGHLRDLTRPYGMKLGG